MAYKLRIICVGKTKEDYLLAAEQDFHKRIKPYASLEILQLKTKANYGSEAPDRIRQQEGELIRNSFQQGAVQIALDERGRQVSSKEFAELINRHLIESGRQVEFVIGGPWGVNQELRSSCHEVIALSRMTFNHRLVRVFLLEQL